MSSQSANSRMCFLALLHTDGTSFGSVKSSLIFLWPYEEYGRCGRQRGLGSTRRRYRKRCGLQRVQRTTRITYEACRPTRTKTCIIRTNRRQNGTYFGIGTIRNSGRNTRGRCNKMRHRVTRYQTSNFTFRELTIRASGNGQTKSRGILSFLRRALSSSRCATCFRATHD